MKKSNVVLGFVLFLSAQAAFAGWRVGSGGDVVYCPGYKDQFGASKIYMLDYLVGYKSLRNRLPLRNVVSLDESLKQMRSLLEGTGLKSSFEKYATFLGNFKNRGYRRWWHLTDKELIDLSDDQFDGHLPRQCYSKVNGKLELNKHQAIVRYSSHQNIIYDLLIPVSKAMKDPKKMAPLQVSFLIIHEWLWDFTRDIKVVRRLNWLLHSQKFASAPTQEKRKLLLQAGIDKLPPHPVYADTDGPMQKILYKSFDTKQIFYVVPKFKKGRQTPYKIFMLPLKKQGYSHCIETSKTKVLGFDLANPGEPFPVYDHPEAGRISKVMPTSFMIQKSHSRRNIRFVAYPYRDIVPTKFCR